MTHTEGGRRSLHPLVWAVSKVQVQTSMMGYLDVNGVSWVAMSKYTRNIWKSQPREIASRFHVSDQSSIIVSVIANNICCWKVQHSYLGFQ